MAGMEGYLRNPTRDKGQVKSEKVGADFLSQRLRFKGVFDLNDLYRIIYDWLVSRGYQVHEKKYKSIVLPGGGKERSFDWEAYRKGNEFVALWIWIHFQIQDAQEIEVVQNGETKKLVKGVLFIRISQDVEMDFSERFAYSKLHQTILAFMAGPMWNKKIETMWEDKQRFKAYELANLIKETLDFMTKGNEHFDVW